MTDGADATPHATDAPSGAGLPSTAPFDRHLGLTYRRVGPDGVEAQLTVTDALLQPAGLVHGGVYCAMVESTASVSAWLWLAEHGGGGVVGVNNTTDFLRAISSGTVVAVTTPLHRGRRQQLWGVVITDERDRVVARGQVRLQNLPPGESRPTGA